MSDVFVRTTAALATLSKPFSCDRYIPSSGTELPDLFMSFSLVTSVPAQHADNAETQRVERVQISIFNRDGLSGLPDVDGAMVAAGFIPGPYRQIPFDFETRHFCLAKDYFVIAD